MNFHKTTICRKFSARKRIPKLWKNNHSKIYVILGFVSFYYYFITFHSTVSLDISFQMHSNNKIKK